MSLPVYPSWDEKSQFFRVIRIKSTEEFEEIIRHFTTRRIVRNIAGIEMSGQMTFLYRGVNNATFRMFSSIQRCLDYRSDKFANKESLPVLMNEIFSRFHRDDNGFMYRSYKEQMPDGTISTHSSIWAFIQHFGGPSPLLDLTSDIESALFFAFDKADLSVLANPTGSMEEYVSLLIFPNNAMTTGEVGAMWATAGDTATQSVNEAERKYGETVNTDAFVVKAVTQPLEQTCWGSMVYGNEDSYRSFRIPDAYNSEVMSAVDNVNITAQFGSFFQGNIIDMLPLEESPIIKGAHFEGGKFGTCIEIPKSLIDDIRSRYRIPVAEEVYPGKDGELKPLYEAMATLWNPIQ